MRLAFEPPSSARTVPTVMSLTVSGGMFGLRWSVARRTYEVSAVLAAMHDLRT